RGGPDGARGRPAATAPRPAGSRNVSGPRRGARAEPGSGSAALHRTDDDGVVLVDVAEHLLVLGQLDEVEPVLVVADLEDAGVLLEVLDHLAGAVRLLEERRVLGDRGGADDLGRRRVDAGLGGLGRRWALSED